MSIVTCNNLGEIIWTKAEENNYRLRNRTDIWRVPVQEHRIDEFAALLNPEELAATDRLFQERDRHLNITAKAMVKILMARYIKTEPELIQPEREPGEKPVIENRLNLQYNVSHSGNWVLVAISDEHVGIDVEEIKTTELSTELIFSQPEQDWVNSPPEDVPHPFYTLWTRKEALLKACGLGIIDELAQVPSLDGTHETDLLPPGNDWQVSSFMVDDEHAGCVAFNGGTLVFRE